MQQFLTYIFWPNPGNAGYTSPKALTLLILCFIFILGSVIIGRWRQRMHNPQLKKVSKSWTKAAGWFGWSGLVLVVARVEGIQYIAMRFLWVIWGVILIGYIALQILLFRNRYYEVIPQARMHDSRANYIPTKKETIGGSELFFSVFACDER